MSTADLLRRAADLIEQRATATSGDWWEAVENYPGSWVVAAGWQQPPVPRRGVRNPPRTDLYVAAESSEGDVREPDTHWIAMLGPQVAAPLAAWLRYAAALIDIQFRDYVDPADPDAVRHIEQMHWHPLAVARSILGEET